MNFVHSSLRNGISEVITYKIIPVTALWDKNEMEAMLVCWKQLNHHFYGFFLQIYPPPLLLENVDNLAFKNCPFKKNTDKFLFSISSTVANMILLHDMSLCLYITRGGALTLAGVCVC